MRKIIHVDMDAFYASVEQRDNPNLRGKPIAVGRQPGERGVIATASYEARKFGVHSAMSSNQAMKLCPNLIIVSPNFDKYSEISEELFEIIGKWTHKIERIALDECYFDVSHHVSATRIAEKLRFLIQEKIGITASCGVSNSKLIAKIASNVNKPNGLFVVPPENVSDFIAKTPVKRINGVGEAMLKKIRQLELGENCVDIQQISFLNMVEYFGLFGERLYYYVRGIDDREVIHSREAQSIGTEETFLKDIYSFDKLRSILNSQLKEVTEKAALKNKLWKTVTLKIRFTDFKTITRSKTILNYTDNFIFWYDELCEIVNKINIDQGIRLSGVTLSNIINADEILELF